MTRSENIFSLELAGEGPNAFYLVSQPSQLSHENQAPPSEPPSHISPREELTMNNPSVDMNDELLLSFYIEDMAFIDSIIKSTRE